MILPAYFPISDLESSFSIIVNYNHYYTYEYYIFMAKKEMYPIERKMDEDNLNRLIRSVERSAKVLKRLLFLSTDTVVILFKKLQGE